MGIGGIRRGLAATCYAGQARSSGVSTVMNYDDEVPEILNRREPDCYPHPFDIKVVWSIYQMVK